MGCRVLGNSCFRKIKGSSRPFSHSRATAAKRNLCKLALLGQGGGGLSIPGGVQGEIGGDLGAAMPVFCHGDFPGFGLCWLPNRAGRVSHPLPLTCYPAITCQGFFKPSLEALGTGSNQTWGL